MLNALGFWSYFFPARHWYTVMIKGRYLPPEYLTEWDAMEWRLDSMEENWNSSVTLFKWTGSFWTRVQ
jgi:hypothetical protein